MVAKSGVPLVQAWWENLIRKHIVMRTVDLPQEPKLEVADGKAIYRCPSRRCGTGRPGTGSWVHLKVHRSEPLFVGAAPAACYNPLPWTANGRAGVQSWPFP